jgi:signal transduction histidine kinase
MSLKARIYIAAVIAVGAAALGHGLYLWAPRDPLRFLCYLALAIPASCLKVTLPRITGTMSVLFMFLLAGIVNLGLPETLVIGVVCVTVQCFWNAKARPRAVQVLFSVATLAATMSATYFVYSAVRFLPSPFRLAIAASVYFVVNTLPIAIVIALTERKSLRQVWSTCYFWCFPYYLVGAAIVSAFSLANRKFDWAGVLILPVMYVVYRSYLLYMNQLEAERKRAERERQHAEETAVLHAQAMEALSSLRVSEERLRIALASASIGTWDYNPVTGALLWDERCKAAFGLPPDAGVDYDTFLTAVHPDDRAAVDKAVQSALDPGGTGKYSTDYRTVGVEDDVLRHIHAEGRAFFDEVLSERRAIRFIGTVQDITRRKQNEEALRRANEDLRQFAYAAAHDLQEPLRNIANSLGLIEHVEQESLHSEARELIHESIESAQRLVRMVKDLLAFTKVVSATQRVAELIDANDVMRQVLRDLNATMSESAAQVTISPLPLVRMETAHLLQLLQNLLGNALKYRRTDVSPFVEISASRSGAEWLFTVADNGIGFDPVYAERIFGVFKRLHPKHEYPGTGIGLAVCSRIVAIYGGRIWAESQPNIGSIFKFTLPGSKAKEKPDAKAKEWNSEVVSA